MRECRDVRVGTCKALRNVTAVGFEPTPFRNGALSHRLRPLGQTVMLCGKFQIILFPGGHWLLLKSSFVAVPVPEISCLFSLVGRAPAQ